MSSINDLSGMIFMQKLQQSNLLKKSSNNSNEITVQTESEKIKGFIDDPKGNEKSLAALDYQGIVNQILVNHKDKDKELKKIVTFEFKADHPDQEDSEKRYQNTQQTININGRDVIFDIYIKKQKDNTKEEPNKVEIFVDKDGVINIKNHGPNVVNFDKNDFEGTEGLKINLLESDSVQFEIDGTQDNDIIMIQDNAKIGGLYAGKGDDIIIQGTNSNGNAVSGGEGDDIIINNSHTTYIGGIKSRNPNIDNDGGNDTIINLDYVQTLNTGNGDDTVVNVGKGKIGGTLNMGNGKDILVQASSNSAQYFIGIENEYHPDGLMYKNGVKLTGISGNQYYKEGELGTGSYKGTYYVNGNPAEGFQEGKFYKSGKPFTGTADAGTANEITYYNGVIANNKVVNGKYYINGQLAQGIQGSKSYYYKNGQLFTGKADDSGTYYYRGVIADKQVVNGKYCISGQPLTGFNDKKLLYKDGKLFSGKADDNGLTYYNGKIVNNATYSGKYYVNGEPANGTYNAKLYQNGKPFTGIVEEGPDKGKTYCNGVIADKQVVNGKYYMNGQPLTGFNDKKLLYKDGKLFSGKADDDGLTYYNGKIVNNATYSGKYYVNGKPANGTYNAKLYQNGKPFTGTVEEGPDKGKTYCNGVIADKQVVNGKYYIAGELAQGIQGSKSYYYKNGQLFTGKADDSGTYYYRGVIADKQVVNGKYCINGQPLTGINDKDLLYKDGKLFTGEASDGLTYYQGKKINNANYKGKYYVNGLPANGVQADGKYYVDGKVFKAK